MEKFNGTFAIRTEETEALFLAWDRMGVKPLFFSLPPQCRLVFALALEALLTHSGAQPWHGQLITPRPLPVFYN